jgi:hypothetical protein
LERDPEPGSADATRRDQQQPKQRSRSDYRWVRRHLSKDDPHFTYAVARELFNIVANHPNAATLLDDVAAQWFQWEENALNLAALDPDETLNEGELFAFLPAVQHKLFAEAIVQVLEHEATRRGKLPFRKVRRSQMATAVSSWLSRKAEAMAHRFGLIYPRRIEKHYARLEAQRSHDVLMALVDTAFAFDLGRTPAVPKYVARRGSHH